MLILLSPAKTLDFDSTPALHARTQPELLEQSDRLACRLKRLSPGEIGQLMGVSDKLAELNFQRFQDWRTPIPKQGSQPAIFAFRGDVYRGFDVDRMTAKQLEYAQEHLRILSGLYGVLRPLDRMLPYRLEMGTPLEISSSTDGKVRRTRGDAGGKAKGNQGGVATFRDLYEFWGDRITEAINRQITKIGARFVLNLASNEYFKSVREKSLDVRVLHPVFKDYKNAEYKVISFFAKQARGSMAAWVVKQKVKTPEKLKKFAEDGYRFSEELSTSGRPVFLRTQ
jgi:uncharacterized protein